MSKQSSGLNVKIFHNRKSAAKSVIFTVYGNLWPMLYIAPVNKDFSKTFKMKRFCCDHKKVQGERKRHQLG